MVYLVLLRNAFRKCTTTTSNVDVDSHIFAKLVSLFENFHSVGQVKIVQRNVKNQGQILLETADTPSFNASSLLARILDGNVDCICPPPSRQRSGSVC